MNEQPDDEFFRKLMTESRHVLEDPEFDSRVMMEIVKRQGYNMIFKQFLSKSLIVIALEASAFFILRIFHISYSGILSGLYFISDYLRILPDHIGIWVVSNGFFVLLIFVILTFIKIMEPKINPS